MRKEKAQKTVELISEIAMCRSQISVSKAPEGFYIQLRRAEKELVDILSSKS